MVYVSTLSSIPDVKYGVIDGVGAGVTYEVGDGVGSGVGDHVKYGVGAVSYTHLTLPTIYSV